MINILRLDYSKAPPGYVVEEMPEAGHLIEAGADIPDLIWRARTDGAVAERRTQEEALSAAWVHYRNRNDPPGMAAWRQHGGPDGDLWLTEVSAGSADYPKARAAAWAWHDRRHALVARLEGEGVQLDMWPAALAWTDDECEVWPGMKATPNDFPAALRRLGGHR